MADTKSDIATSVETQEVDKAQESKTAESKKPDTSQEAEFNLSEEQWQKVFEHDRFKQLNQKAKEAEKALKEKLEAEKAEKQKKLKEEGKLQELLDETKKELDELKGSYSTKQLENQILSIASRLNVVDTDAVVRLVDSSKIEYDKEGNPTNVEDVVTTLLKEKSYLTSTDKSPDVGAGSNATTESQSADFVITKSELKEKLKDYKWYEDNKENIKQWEKEGRIDYTR